MKVFVIVHHQSCRHKWQVYRWLCLQRRQICDWCHREQCKPRKKCVDSHWPPVMLTLVVNLPLVLLTLVVNLPPVSTMPGPELKCLVTLSPERRMSGVIQRGEEPCCWGLPDGGWQMTCLVMAFPPPPPQFAACSLIRVDTGQHALKKLFDILVLSRDVTYQTLPGRE